MSTSFKSSPNPIFHPTEQGVGETDRIRSPYAHDLVPTLTLATPSNSLYTRPACLAAGRRSYHHDA
jgi:hypothetical protein